MTSNPPSGGSNLKKSRTLKVALGIGPCVLTSPEDQKYGVSLTASGRTLLPAELQFLRDRHPMHCTQASQRMRRRTPIHNNKSVLPSFNRFNGPQPFRSQVPKRVHPAKAVRAAFDPPCSSQNQAKAAELGQRPKESCLASCTSHPLSQRASRKFLLLLTKQDPIHRHHSL